MGLIKRDLPVLVFELHTDNTSSNYSNFKEFFDSVDYELFEVCTDLNSGTWGLKIIKTLRPNRQFNILAKSKFQS